MRFWVITLAALCALPMYADTKFRAAKMVHNNVPFGKAQCDIRLQVDNEVEVTLRRDMVSIHTLAGQEARNDGSECSAPLPDRDLRGFDFQSVETRNDMRLVDRPTRDNDFSVKVVIHDTASGSGRYHFRVTWDVEGPETRGDRNATHAPEGFSWNNVVNFHGRGQGESHLNDITQRLANATVDIDHGGKIVVTFAAERRSGKPVVFTGSLMGRDGSHLKADMLTEDRRLRGTMMLQVDDRQNVNSITLEATDGRDHLHLTWDRK